MKSQTEYLTFNIPARMDFVNITPQVRQVVVDSGVQEGLCLVNAMHITASVFIDEAYLYTFDHGPPQVSKEEDDGRTIYVVDLGRRIGYVGGQRGRRNDHPAAHHVQLILEGTNVITAYPVRRR